MKYTYTFDQLRDNEAGITARFMNYEWIQNHGGVDTENYFTADGGTIDAATPKAACEKIYRLYNSAEMPIGYTSRSMSVSDIVNLWDNEQNPPVKTSWYCDSIGFVQIDDKGRECLKAEWIAHRNLYRLYKPGKEQNTVAYVESLNDVDEKLYCVSEVEGFNEIIEEFSKVQREGHFPCPRCGNHRMADDPIRNALSRKADIQICDACGMDEAIRDFSGNPLQSKEWDIMKNPNNYIK